MKKTFIIFSIIINMLLPIFVSADDYHLKNNGEDIKVPYNLPQTNSVVKIYSKMRNEDDYGFGTGIFLNNHFILTAAHNLIGDSGNNNLDDIEDLGFITETNTNIEPVIYNNELEVPNARNHSLKNSSLKNRTIYFFDLENYNNLIKSKTIESRKYDLALIEVKENTLILDKNEKPKLAKESNSLSKNDSIYFLGFPGINTFKFDYLENNSKLTPEILTGKIYKVSGSVIENKQDSSILLYNTSSIGGMSGAGIFNKNNELIGLHLFFANVKDLNIVYSGGMKFNDIQINWINSLTGESKTQLSKNKETKNETSDKEIKRQSQQVENTEETIKHNNNYQYIILFISFGLGVIILYKSIKKN